MRAVRPTRDPRSPRTGLSARALLAAAATAAIAACGPTPLATAPEPSPVLAAGTWRLVAVNGRALPAVAAHDTAVGEALETFADSAVLTVTAAGRYQQRIWLRTVRSRDAVVLGRVVVGDVGRVVVGPDSGATLASTFHTWRAPSSVRRLGHGEAELVEQVRHDPVGRVTARYERR